MYEQLIDLKQVNQLRLDASDQPIRYRIPAYQRGYRWTRQQVTQLLEDVRDFAYRDYPEPQEFYCLQPLVLRPNQDTFEVVDGQQRLTTLLLILRHFNERLAAKYRLKLFTLQYDTRADLYAFLDNPSDQLAAANIDYFHIDQAVKTIATWFETRESEVEKIKSAFLNDTKVIWYQLAAAENAVEAFTRLNVGKIALTNGELIRALFLKQGVQDDKEDAGRRLRIAYEWDLLEKNLQNAEFWFFVSNDRDQAGNRIGLLFDLAALADGMTDTLDTYATFYRFSRKLNDPGARPEQVWLEIKSTFMLLEEWFDDRRLYHLVGFLIWVGLDVNQLLRLAADSSKRDFKHKLRTLIFHRTIDSSHPQALNIDQLRERITDRVEGLKYGPHTPRIRSLLLLFNLATLLQNRQSNVRFQFESFKTASWDIEHVRSVAQDRPGNRRGQAEWLAGCLGYYEDTGAEPELQTEIKAFLDLPSEQATDALFEPLYEKLLNAFQETSSDEADHTIANLVLLDSDTNRSYKNAVFAVKRQRILSLDRHGVFVPLCTRNVFLKCYSQRVDHAMFWTQDDRDDYRQTLIDTLVGFFHGGWIDE